MFSLIPKEMVFFDLFEEAAKNAHSGALALQDLLEDFRNVSEKARRIKDIEHAGDKITHTTIEKLNQTFITPLDRLGRPEQRRHDGRAPRAWPLGHEAHHDHRYRSLHPGRAVAGPAARVRPGGASPAASSGPGS